MGFLGGDAFNTISSLIRHRKCVHEGAKKVCPICHKEMSRNANMKEHIDTVHKGLTNHSCEICGKRFGRQTHLSRHKKTSHNIFPPKKTNLVHEEYDNRKPLDLPLDFPPKKSNLVHEEYDNCKPIDLPLDLHKN